MSEEELQAIEDLKKTINYYDKKFKDNERITSVLVDNFDVNNLYITFSPSKIPTTKDPIFNTSTFAPIIPVYV